MALQSSTGRLLVRGAIVRVAQGVLVIVAGFLMMPFLLDRLGDATYGVWAVLVAFAGLSFVLDLGLTSAVMRFIAEAIAHSDARRVNSIVSNALVIHGGLGLVVAIIAAMLAALAPHWTTPEAVSELRACILILGVNIALGFPFRSIAGIAQARVRYDVLSAGFSVAFLMQTAAAVILVMRGYGIVGLSIATFIGNQGQHVFELLVAKRLFPELRPSMTLLDRSLTRDLLAYSSWTSVAGIAEQLRARGEPILITALAGPVAVTHYQIGSQLVDYCRTLLLQATNFVTPVFARQFALGDVKSIAPALSLLVRVCLGLAVLAAIGLTALSTELLTAWVGAEYASIHPVVVILAVALVFHLATIPMENYFYATAMHRFVALAGVFDLVIRASLAIALWKPMGLVGVATAVLVATIVSRGVLVTALLKTEVFKFHAGRAARWGGGLTLTALVSSLVGLVCNSLSRGEGFAGIVPAGLALSAIHTAGIAFLLFTKEERLRILSAVPVVGRLASKANS